VVPELRSPKEARLEKHLHLLPAVTGALLLAACARGGDVETVTYSCIEEYSPGTLVQRSFAFDGTVASIELRSDSHLPSEDNQVHWVTFAVNRWFRGGSVSQVGVWIDSLNLETSVGTIEAEPGTRLLVAGEPRWGGEPLQDPIAWPCGFTQPWTPGTAADWEAAFR
jgi:hypothetical protein